MSRQNTPFFEELSCCVPWPCLVMARSMFVVVPHLKPCLFLRIVNTTMSKRQLSVLNSTISQNLVTGPPSSCHCTGRVLSVVTWHSLPSLKPFLPERLKAESTGLPPVQRVCTHTEILLDSHCPNTHSITRSSQATNHLKQTLSPLGECQRGRIVMESPHVFGGA